MPRSSRNRMMPPAAARPKALPPVSSTAWTRSINMPGRSASVPSVAAAAPRTSTPPTAPSGVSTTVHPVRPVASVQWPTLTPAGSSNDRAVPFNAGVPVLTLYRSGGESTDVAVDEERVDQRDRHRAEKGPGHERSPEIDVTLH